MSRRRRRSLIDRSPTSERAPERLLSQSTRDDDPDAQPSDEALDAPEPSAKASEPDASGPEATAAAQKPSIAERWEPPSGEDPMDAPAIAPPMLIDDAFPAPKSSRDLAQVEKQEAPVEELFDKKVETANPAPVRTEAGDAFPKDFEEEDDWFVKTGQPAPDRVEKSPEAPPKTVEPNPWPMVIGALVVAGLVGLVGIAMVVMS